MQSLSRAAQGVWAAAAAARAPQQPLGRGIRVKVRDGNLERALGQMERRMRSSGMERLIKRRTDRHVKNSEKRALARKDLLFRIRSDDLAKKLRTVFLKKIRGE